MDATSSYLNRSRLSLLEQRLAEALKKATGYLGGPTDGCFSGLQDNDAVRHTTMVRLGDIREMRAALAAADRAASSSTEE